MKNIKKVFWNIDEANRQTKKNFDGTYWKFIVKQAGYKEITFDEIKKEISFPSYIPITNVIDEILDEIDNGCINVSICRVCGEYFNIDAEDGIFGDPQNLKRFICQKCSEKISAREFYEKHMNI